MLKKHTYSVNNFLEHLNGFEDKIAVIFESQQITYKGLCEQSQQLAKYFVSQNYKKVMFSTSNSPFNIFAYLSCWLSGLECYPVNPRLTANELITIIHQTKPCIIYVSKDQYTQQLVDTCLTLNISLIVLAHPQQYLKQINHLYIAHSIPINPNSITYHISSGSGGQYRLHGHTTQQILDYAYQRERDFGLQDKDMLLIALSINHAYAFSYQLLPALAMGLTTALMTEFNAQEITTLIANFPISNLALLPTMYYFLCQEVLKHSTFKHQLRFLSVAGDQPSQSLMKLVEKTFNQPLLNGIGMTEVFGFSQNTQKTQLYNEVSLLSDVSARIRVFKSKQNTDTDIQYGEVLLKTPMLPINHKGAWLATGDFGYLHYNKLYFLGRIKDIIIKGGSNISPLELEHYLYQLADIKEIAIIGKKDDIWGELICACINDTQKQTDIQTLNKHLKQYLAPYKLLDHVYHFDELPKNVTGKIDRHRLSQLIN